MFNKLHTLVPQGSPGAQPLCHSRHDNAFSPLNAGASFTLPPMFK